MARLRFDPRDTAAIDDALDQVADDLAESPVEGMNNPPAEVPDFPDQPPPTTPPPDPDAAAALNRTTQEEPYPEGFEQRPPDLGLAQEPVPEDDRPLQTPAPTDDEWYDTGPLPDRPEAVGYEYEEPYPEDFEQRPQPQTPSPGDDAVARGLGGVFDTGLGLQAPRVAVGPLIERARAAVGPGLQAIGQGAEGLVADLTTSALRAERDLSQAPTAAGIAAGVLRPANEFLATLSSGQPKGTKDYALSAIRPQLTGAVALKESAVSAVSSLLDEERTTPETALNLITTPIGFAMGILVRLGQAAAQGVEASYDPRNRTDPYFVPEAIIRGLTGGKAGFEAVVYPLQTPGEGDLDFHKFIQNRIDGGRRDIEAKIQKRPNDIGLNQQLQDLQEFEREWQSPAGTLAGLAGTITLDPSNFLPFGAIGKAFKAVPGLRMIGQSRRVVNEAKADAMGGATYNAMASGDWNSVYKMTDPTQERPVSDFLAQAPIVGALFRPDKQSLFSAGVEQAGYQVAVIAKDIDDGVLTWANIKSIANEAKGVSNEAAILPERVRERLQSMKDYINRYLNDDGSFKPVVEVKNMLDGLRPNLDNSANRLLDDAIDSGIVSKIALVLGEVAPTQIEPIQKLKNLSNQVRNIKDFDPLSRALEDEVDRIGRSLGFKGPSDWVDIVRNAVALTKGGLLTGNPGYILVNLLDNLFKHFAVEGLSISGFADATKTVEAYGRPMTPRMEEAGRTLTADIGEGRLRSRVQRGTLLDKLAAKMGRLVPEEPVGWDWFPIAGHGYRWLRESQGKIEQLSNRAIAVHQTRAALEDAVSSFIPAIERYVEVGKAGTTDPATITTLDNLKSVVVGAFQSNAPVSVETLTTIRDSLAAVGPDIQRAIWWSPPPVTDKGAYLVLDTYADIISRIKDINPVSPTSLQDAQKVLDEHITDIFQGARNQLDYLGLNRAADDILSAQSRGKTIYIQLAYDRFHQALRANDHPTAILAGLKALWARTNESDAAARLASVARAAIYKRAEELARAGDKIGADALRNRMVKEISDEADVVRAGLIDEATEVAGKVLAPMPIALAAAARTARGVAKDLKSRVQRIIGTYDQQFANLAADEEKYFHDPNYIPSSVLEAKVWAPRRALYDEMYEKIRDLYAEQIGLIEARVRGETRGVADIRDIEYRRVTPVSGEPLAYDWAYWESMDNIETIARDLGLPHSIVNDMDSVVRDVAASKQRFYQWHGQKIEGDAAKTINYLIEWRGQLGNRMADAARLASEPAAPVVGDTLRNTMTTIIRGWSNYLDWAFTHGDNESRRILFDYRTGKTKIDRILDFFSPFTLWQTRNIPYYIEASIRSPRLPYMAMNYYQESEKEREKYDLPPSYRGYYPVGGDQAPAGQGIAPGRPYANFGVVVSAFQQTTTIANAIWRHRLAQASGDEGRINRANLEVTQALAGGLGLYPHMQAALTAVGLLGDNAEMPWPFPHIPLYESLTYAGINPEMLLTNVQRLAVRTQYKLADREPPIDNDPVLQRTIEQVLANMVLNGQTNPITEREMTQADQANALTNRDEDPLFRYARATAGEAIKVSQGRAIFNLTTFLRFRTPEETEISAARALNRMPQTTDVGLPPGDQPPSARYARRIDATRGIAAVGLKLGDLERDISAQQDEFFRLPVGHQPDGSTPRQDYLKTHNALDAFFSWQNAVEPKMGKRPSASEYFAYRRSLDVAEHERLGGFPRGALPTYGVPETRGELLARLVAPVYREGIPPSGTWTWQEAKAVEVELNEALGEYYKFSEPNRAFNDKWFAASKEKRIELLADPGYKPWSDALADRARWVSDPANPRARLVAQWLGWQEVTEKGTPEEKTLQRRVITARTGLDEREQFVRTLLDNGGTIPGIGPLAGVSGPIESIEKEKTEVAQKQAEAESRAKAQIAARPPTPTLAGELPKQAEIRREGVLREALDTYYSARDAEVQAFLAQHPGLRGPAFTAALSGQAASDGRSLFDHWKESRARQDQLIKTDKLYALISEASERGITTTEGLMGYLSLPRRDAPQGYLSLLDDPGSRQPSALESRQTAQPSTSPTIPLAPGPTAQPSGPLPTSPQPRTPSPARPSQLPAQAPAQRLSVPQTPAGQPTPPRPQLTSNDVRARQLNTQAQQLQDQSQELYATARTIPGRTERQSMQNEARRLAELAQTIWAERRVLLGRESPSEPAEIILDTRAIGQSGQISGRPTPPAPQPARPGITQPTPRLTSPDAVGYQPKPVTQAPLPISQDTEQRYAIAVYQALPEPIRQELRGWFKSGRVSTLSVRATTYLRSLWSNAPTRLNFADWLSLFEAFDESSTYKDLARRLGVPAR